MASGTSESTLLGKLANDIKGGVKQTVMGYKSTLGEPMNLGDISKIARVEPITLVSSSLNGVKEIHDILHGVLNVYASYYLQAVNILSAELIDVRILKILDKTNPDRSLKTLLASSSTAYESHNLKTLTLENAKFKLPMLTSDIQTSHATENIIDTMLDESGNTIGSSIEKISTFEKMPSAVGKVVSVTFKVRGENTSASDAVSIPVSVKLDTMVIPAETLSVMISSNTEDITLSGRFKDAIAGRIGFIKDFLLCSDLIKQQKKTMIKDPTGYYSQILKRVSNSRFYSALSGNVSLAGISSVIVISEEEEAAIQRKLGGKLTNNSTRKIVFDNMSAFAIIVVDREWERVTMYFRDQESFGQYSFKEFKHAGDANSGQQIADMVKAFAMSTPPSF